LCALKTCIGQLWRAKKSFW